MEFSDKKKKEISKVIHYCWFGSNPLSEMAKKCIASWQKYCPDYEIKEWNEGNFDINCNRYVKEAYESKKWAFVSDVARLRGLMEYGGFYMDTDVELLKNLDELRMFDGISGFETREKIQTAFIGSKPDNPFFKEILSSYETEQFIRSDGSFNLETNVVKMTKLLKKKGLVLNNKKQTICNVTIFPQDFFSPKELESGLINLTANSYIIHHFEGSWKSEEDIYIYSVATKLKDHLPLLVAKYLGYILGTFKFNGIAVTIRRCLGWLSRKMRQGGEK